MDRWFDNDRFDLNTSSRRDIFSTYLYMEGSNFFGAKRTDLAQNYIQYQHNYNK